MKYNDEQRAAASRLQEISVRWDATMAAEHAAHATMSHDIFTELTAAIERSNEIGALQREYGVAFREFLNTL
jgi:hypothetical protein